MTKFMVQIVLHDSETPAAYERLERPMKKRGFTRELAGRKASYHLPTGTYWCESDESPNEVRLLAAAAADTAGLDFGVVVIRANGWSVMRLKKVEAASQG